MADIQNRIIQARREIDESLDNGDFLHNIVVAGDDENTRFTFYCLSVQHTWAEVAISAEVLTGPLGRFGTTVEHASELVKQQFGFVHDEGDGSAVLPDEYTDGAFFDTDPRQPATGQLELPPVTGATSIPSFLAAQTGSIQAPRAPHSELLSSDEPQGLMGRLRDRIEGRPGTAESGR